MNCNIFVKDCKTFERQVKAVAESALFQKLRRLARKFELQIRKLKGENLFVLVGDSVSPAPMTLQQLQEYLSDLDANNQD